MRQGTRRQSTKSRQLAGMKKLAWILIVAVVAPSLILGALAIRSLRDQRFVLERQQSAVYQGVADSFAKRINSKLEEKQLEFGEKVQALLARTDETQLATTFDEALCADWPLAEVGFVISPGGQVLSPSLFSRPEARQFRLDNDRFFCCDSVEVYWTPVLTAASTNSSPPTKTEQRSVAPTCVIGPNIGTNQAVSKVASAPAEFVQLMGSAKEGVVARFLRDQLKLMLWYKPTPSKMDSVYGVQLNLPKFIGEFRALAKVEPAFAQDIVVAFLDDAARPIALSDTNYAAPNWKRPFVASEVGEALPHWEVGVYLKNPAKMGHSAKLATIALASLISGLFVVIAIGCWFVIRCLRKELDLAQQKTDFVSNVSHELKTPLTSIRMFSELLANGHVDDAEKRRSYSNIITAETARLSRLINNVLDFARISHGEKKYNFQQCDAADVVRSTVESYRPNLESKGFTVKVQLPQQPLMVNADRDALAQVLVNLISNAEKYSNGTKEIEIDGARSNGTVRIEVLDRGTGIPVGSEEKIFEQFYRAHESLSSGIQGSGLGLTLARQIARAHGGDVVFHRRETGGSCFVIELKSNN